jgi:hypothetical protein
MWSEFQQQSSDKLKAATTGVDNFDIVVWTSHLTLPEYIANLPSDDYIIQIWTNGTVRSDSLAMST